MTVLGFVVAAIVGANQDPLTIDEAVKIAIGNAYSVQIAQSQADQARQNQNAARGASKPQLVMGGQYIRLAEGVSGSVGGSGFGGSASDSKQLSLVLSQLIDISGISRKTVDAARFNRLASEKSAETAINEVKRIVRQQFYLVLEARALVGVQQDELASAKQRLANAKIRQVAGDISQFDVLRLETDAKRSEQALLNAEGNYTLSKQALNSILGRPIETEFNPSDVLSLTEVTLDARDALDIAIKSRPEVVAGDYLVQSARKLVEVEQGSLKPSLTFSAQYNRQIDPVPGQAVQSLFGILTLSYPLWDSGVTRARMGAAREVENQAKVRLEQTMLGVSLDVRSALTQLETTKKGYEVALSGETLAKESLRLAQLRYDEGAGILLDVTTAQAELTRSRASVVTARYQYLTAFAALQRALGRDDFNTASQSEGGL